MSVIDKLVEITNIINDIEKEDPGTAIVLREGFGLSLNILQAAAETGKRENVDVSEHLQIITKILGISLEELVANVLQSQQSDMVDKAPDEETLKFITADLDDYEKFLAQNKAKDALDFLSKQI